MNRRHFSQREIAQHLNISKTSVFEILKESELSMSVTSMSVI